MFAFLFKKNVAFDYPNRKSERVYQIVVLESACVYLRVCVCVLAWKGTEEKGR